MMVVVGLLFESDVINESVLWRLSSIIEEIKDVFDHLFDFIWFIGGDVPLGYFSIIRESIQDLLLLHLHRYVVSL